MSDAPQPLGRRKRWRRSGLIALAALCVLGVLAEIGARIVLAVRGSAYDSAATVASAEKIAGSIVARDVRGEVKPSAMVLNPFVGYAKREMQDELAKEIAYYGSPESERNYDVAVIGGTFAERFGGEGESELRATLAKEPNFADRPIHVWSHGCEGYKEPQSIQMLSFLLAVGCKPDAVVLLDGTEELRAPVSNLQSGVFALYPRAETWTELSANAGTDRVQLDALLAIRSRQRFVVGVEKFALQFGVQYSAALGTLLTSWMERAQQGVELRTRGFAEERRSSPRMRIQRGPRVEIAPPAIDQMSLRAWFESSRSMHAICAEHGIAFVHVLEPTIGDSNDLAQVPPQALEALHRKLANAGRALATDGVSFFDAQELWGASIDGNASGSSHTRAELVAALARGVARRVARVPITAPGAEKSR